MNYINDGAGAWVVYSFDNGEYAISLHGSAAEAARSAARAGYGAVAWWPFGFELTEAISEWTSPDAARDRKSRPRDGEA